MFGLSRVKTNKVDFTNVIHPCHFEQSEKSKVGNGLACNDFRFLSAFGMTVSEICEIVSLIGLGLGIIHHIPLPNLPPKGGRNKMNGNYAHL